MLVLIGLIVHGLCAVVLLGALSHQAFSLLPKRKVAVADQFFTRYRSVSAHSFSTPIVITYTMTFLLGASIYPLYRLDVRPAFEEMALASAIGAFELKEHWAAIGLGLLPAYWLSWKNNVIPVKHSLTWLLLMVVWFDFLSGHVLNNIRGL